MRSCVRACVRACGSLDALDPARRVHIVQLADALVVVVQLSMHHDLGERLGLIRRVACERCGGGVGASAARRRRGGGGRPYSTCGAAVSGVRGGGERPWRWQWRRKAAAAAVVVVVSAVVASGGGGGGGQRPWRSAPRLSIAWCTSSASSAIRIGVVATAAIVPSVLRRSACLSEVMAGPRVVVIVRVAVGTRRPGASWCLD